MALRRVAFVDTPTGNVLSDVTYDDVPGVRVAVAPSGQTMVDVPAGVDPVGQRWNGVAFVARADRVPAVPLTLATATDRQVMDAIARRLGIGV